MRILTILLVICLTACSNPKKVEKSLSANSNNSITLERTGCYGTCPIYRVTIYGNGVVDYIGKRHVDNIGIFEGQLSKESLLLLFAYLEELDWNNYPEAYPIDNVDFPQFNLKYEKGNKVYRIKANSRADEELIALSKQIDFVIRDLIWDKTEDTISE